VGRDPKNATHSDNLFVMRVKLADAYSGLQQWSKAVETMGKALRGVADTAIERTLTSSEQEWRQTGSEKLAGWKRLAAGR
jgi:hypothetical protein